MAGRKNDSISIISGLVLVAGFFLTSSHFIESDVVEEWFLIAIETNAIISVVLVALTFFLYKLLGLIKHDTGYYNICLSLVFLFIGFYLLVNHGIRYFNASLDKSKAVVHEYTVKNKREHVTKSSKGHKSYSYYLECITENGSAVEIKVKDYNKLNEFNVGDTAIVSYKKGYFGFEHYAGAPRNKKNIPQGLILKD